MQQTRPGAAQRLVGGVLDPSNTPRVDERTAPEFARVTRADRESEHDRSREGGHRDRRRAIAAAEQQVQREDGRRELQGAREPDARPLPAARVRTAEVVENERRDQDVDLPVAERRPHRLEPECRGGGEQAQPGRPGAVQPPCQRLEPQREAQHDRKQEDVPGAHQGLDRAEALGCEGREGHRRQRRICERERTGKAQRIQMGAAQDRPAPQAVDGQVDERPVPAERAQQQRNHRGGIHRDAETQPRQSPGALARGRLDRGRSGEGERGSAHPLRVQMPDPPPTGRTGGRSVPISRAPRQAAAPGRK